MQSDPFANPENSYSIAVTGAMNPALHHPAWYAYIGAITEQEADAAAQAEGSDSAGSAPPPGDYVPIDSQRTFCSPQFSQFTIDRLRIACLPQSWTGSSLDESGLDRIAEIIQKVFGALVHTPVWSYTISFTHHRATTLPDVGNHLAKAASKTGLGFLHEKFASSEAAQLRYVAKSESRDLVVDVQPSILDSHKIFLAIYSIHRIAPVPQPSSRVTIFDLGPLVREAVAADRLTADSWLRSILAATTGSVNS